MSRNREIEEKVQEALNSLDGIRRVTPPSFLYTRVMARLERRKESVWDSLSGVLMRPAVAFLSVSLVLTVNIFIIIATSNAPAVSEASELAVADEYSTASAIYDLENPVP